MGASLTFRLRGVAMFERFTDRARRVVVLAQDEARLLNHNYIGTEHLLLGLLSERDGVACEALESLGVSLEAARRDVEEMIGKGKTAATGHVPFTPRAKKVLEISLREALQLGHNYIGTEHILLGLVREGEGVAAQVLVKQGAGLSSVREQVIGLVSARPRGEGSGVERVHPHMHTPRGPFTGAVSYLWAGTQPTLVRVVPLAREVELADAVRLVLLSLEIWSGWVDLRLATIGSGEGQVARPVASYGDWRLADDCGTDYRTVGASSSGDEKMQVSQVSFSPSPPAEATTLTLTLPGAGEGEGGEEIRVVVELAQAAS
jgi:hypothetical protein